MRDSQTGPAGTAAAECLGILGEQAAAYAEVAVANIGREFPSHLVHLMTEPGDFPARPAERTPVFYGSLDWHSCVEMHWLLVRLLRLAGNRCRPTRSGMCWTPSSPRTSSPRR